MNLNSQGVGNSKTRGQLSEPVSDSSSEQLKHLDTFLGEKKVKAEYAPLSGRLQRGAPHVVDSLKC